jgi:transcription elongation factor Elf1
LAKPIKEEIKPCPRCGHTEAEQVQFTWWGGILGAAMLHQVKCKNCGLEYNGQTGETNQKNIWIYSAIVFAIILVVILIQAFLHR